MQKNRVEILTNILSSDSERARKLLTLPPNEALVEINNLGYDFTLQEIYDYGEIIKQEQSKNPTSEELEVGTLDNVAGGKAIVSVAVDVW